MGTHYGSNDRSEYLNDIVSYDLNGETYLVTLSTSNATSGSTVSDVDKFPLAQLPNTGAWFQSANPGSTPAHSFSLGITRFKVGNISNYISVKENLVSESSPWKIFPNPANDVFRIVCQQDFELKKVKIYDVNGRCVLAVNGGLDLEFDISNLASGVYFVNTNDASTQKLIKQ